MGINNVSVSRISNSKKNIVYGVTKQLIGIGLTFCVRTLLIYRLGVQYQGLNSLFSSILQILNLTDLGFSAAVTYILYKPIADDDTETICCIVAFLKKVYRIVGTVLLVIGAVVSLFIPYLISGDYPNDINIYLLFYIFLINSSISYFLFAYKSTLLTALQRDDLVSKAHLISSITMRIIQIGVLFLFKNFYFFALVMVLGSIINNLLAQFFSRKFFPQFIPKGRMDSELKKDLKKQVSAVFVNRLSDVARNGFDDVIISTLLGLTLVAVYDNYYYILTAIVGFMSIVIHGVRASVGNSIVTESIEKNYNDLRRFSFLFMWLSGWCSVCLLCLYQPFMRIWMSNNNEVVFPDHIMFLFCLYFYTLCVTHTKNIYSEARGLFWECRFLYIIEAVANLVLNIVLGYFFGIIGIIVATIITIVLINFFCGARILFKHYFTFGYYRFLIDHLKYGIITTIVGGGCYCICRYFIPDGVIGFLIRIVVCIFVPNILFLSVYCKTKLFKDCLRIVKRTLKN